MQLPSSQFTAVDWSQIEPTVHPGDQGEAIWRTLQVGDMRLRRVDYSPGYLADHWCNRGHVIFVLDGELVSHLSDGRSVTLTPGMSYHVSDLGDASHRSSTTIGAKLFIVD